MDWRKLRKFQSTDDKIRNRIAFSTIAACLLHVEILLSYGMRNAEHHRNMAGALVVFLSNTVPKQAGSGRALAMRRAVGCAMVLGGMGHALAWVLLPMAYAGNAAVSVMLLAVGNAAVRFLWFVHQCRSRPSAG